MSFFSKLIPDFHSQDETKASLMLAAQTLHRAAISGNDMAIQEIQQGLADLFHWEYAGLIERGSNGGFVLRDERQPVTSSGPIPLGGKLVVACSGWRQ